MNKFMARQTYEFNGEIKIIRVNKKSIVYTHNGKQKKERLNNTGTYQYFYPDDFTPLYAREIEHGYEIDSDSD